MINKLVFLLKFKNLYIPIIITILTLSILTSAQYSDNNLDNISKDNDTFQNINLLNRNILVRIKIDANLDYILDNFDVMGFYQDKWVDVNIPYYKLIHLNKNNYDYKILIWNLDLYTANRAREYRSFEEMEDFLVNISNNYPDITNLFSLGKTYQNRDIWCLEITDNPGLDENEPGVLFTGLHHAREWPTLEICLYIIENLTANYTIDPEITNLINNRRLWIIPCVNPDGYHYDHDLGNDWRKNRHYFPEYDSWGVDLNRNYGGSSNGDPWAAWGSLADGSGSHHPSNSLYCGPSPISENESTTVKNFILETDISGLISWHTHGELVIWPWGYSRTEITPDNSLHYWKTNFCLYNRSLFKFSPKLYLSSTDM